MLQIGGVRLRVGLSLFPYIYVNNQWLVSLRARGGLRQWLNSTSFCIIMSIFNVSLKLRVCFLGGGCKHRVNSIVSSSGGIIDVGWW